MKRAAGLFLAVIAPLACGRDPVFLLGGTGLDAGLVAGVDATPQDTGPTGRDALVTDLPLPPDGGPNPFDAGARDAAEFECVRPADCFRLGQPPCPPGQQGTWACVDSKCEASCSAPVCRTDCDCPFELACAMGQCLPLNRANQCCLNPFCQPGSRCVNPDGTRGTCPVQPPDGGVPPRPDAGPRDSGVPLRDSGVPPPPDSGVPPPDSGVPAPDAGPRDSGTDTPVGAPCMSMAECGGFGFCIDESAGFPDGYCSQPCGRGAGLICPSDAVCRGFGMGNNICLDGCLGPADCRMGYACVQLGIQPDRVCFPVPPGSSNPNGAPVGSACMGDEDCAATLTCLQLPQGWRDGYCTRLYCDPVTNPCPTSSLCYAFPGSFSACLESCPSGGSQSTCRMGYYCLGPTGQPGVCISN